MVMSDNIFLFNTGSIEQSGTPIEMYTMPASRYAASSLDQREIQHYTNS
jgi:putative spermidine/putrescine transport system ATP-binding protein